MIANACDFHFKGWDLMEAIDALVAYHMGAWDSGVNDETMVEAVRSYLADLEPAERRKTCALYARKYLTDGAIDEGHGLGDVVEFVEWLSSIGIAAS